MYVSPRHVRHILFEFSPLINFPPYLPSTSLDPPKKAVFAKYVPYPPTTLAHSVDIDDLFCGVDVCVLCLGCAVISCAFGVSSERHRRPSEFCNQHHNSRANSPLIATSKVQFLPSKMNRFATATLRAATKVVSKSEKTIFNGMSSCSIHRHPSHHRLRVLVSCSPLSICTITISQQFLVGIRVSLPH
jgi:hypothetical protein